MGKYKGLCFLIVVFSVAHVSASIFGGVSKPVRRKTANVWEHVVNPSQGPAQAIGFHSRGCLRGAGELPSEGVGFEVVHLNRKRNFGHSRLLDFIQKFSKQTKSEKMGELLIGDMSQPRGGPIPSSHISHQVGLDVDVWFYQLPDGTFLDPNQRDELKAPSMVNFQTGKVDSRYWTENKIRILEIAAGDPDVDRIFVNSIIKTEICKNYRGQTWLHKLRTWTGHHDHFHVRLKCGSGDLCENEAEIPFGDGCKEIIPRRGQTFDEDDEDGPVEPLPLIAETLLPGELPTAPSHLQSSQKTVRSVCQEVLREK